MNGFGLTVIGPWPQFTVALALTSALTSATAGTARSQASCTETAHAGAGAAATLALAASTVAHRTLEALALIGSGADMLAPSPHASAAAPPPRRPSRKSTRQLLV